MSLENDIIKVRFKADSPELKAAKAIAIFFTILYVVAFPFVLYGLFYSTIFTLLSIKETPIEGLISILISLSIPLSMVISIGKMWSSYNKQLISKIRLQALLPFLTILALILIYMIQRIVLIFYK